MSGLGNNGEELSSSRKSPIGLPRYFKSGYGATDTSSILTLNFLREFFLRNIFSFQMLIQF